MTPLEIRQRQEKLYTLHLAERVAKGEILLSPAEKATLNRYARWHMETTFEALVAERRNVELPAGGAPARVILPPPKPRFRFFRR